MPQTGKQTKTGEGNALRVQLEKSIAADSQATVSGRDYLTPEINLIKDLDALVSMSRQRGHMIPTKGVKRAIEAARDHGLHNLADEASKLAGI